MNIQFLNKPSGVWALGRPLAGNGIAYIDASVGIKIF